MDLKYKSTRGSKSISSMEGILKGISEDGGLYVPEYIPEIDKSFEELKDLSYQELAEYIIGKYFTDFTEEELKNCVYSAYDEKFTEKEVVPISTFGNTSFLELYHGATLAFKDMALSILPHFMVASMKKLNCKNEIVVLAATSGDTGKAALEGFKNVEGTKVIVFYPKSGVSQVQERQMITQEGANTFVVSMEGNFDDAQNGVKKAFNDNNFKEELCNKGFELSSANSINIGRLVPQVVYYVYGYLQLLKEEQIQSGEKINVVVPTGNFGNILSAYYAKKMGIPIDKLICASNENNVLYDFLETGKYDRRRELELTISPSMDILVSSNLERLLYEINNGDSKATSNFMEKLNKEGFYEINDNMRENLKDFYGGFTSEIETLETISSFYNREGYLMDTHTAVAYNVYEKYREETKDNKKTIIASTASPFKFTRSVSEAIGIEIKNKTDFELIYELSEKANIDIPKSIYRIEDYKIIHDLSCEKANMNQIVKKVLNVGD